MDYDVIIVGAGPGGIFTAPYLKVVMVENYNRSTNAAAPSTARR